MYVAVQHTITDPKAFWSKAQQAIPAIPSNLKLHHTFPSTDGKRAICIWEAKSPEEVKNFLEPEMGSVSKNEYFGVENKESIALPQAFAGAA